MIISFEEREKCFHAQLQMSDVFRVEGLTSRSPPVLWHLHPSLNQASRPWSCCCWFQKEFTGFWWKSCWGGSRTGTRWVLQGARRNLWPWLHPINVYCVVGPFKFFCQVFASFFIYCWRSNRLLVGWRTLTLHVKVRDPAGAHRPELINEASGL